MSVGCYDADMQKYVHVPPNLELMKLSTYYKKKGEIVSLAPVFKPQRYTKFIYRKDFFDNDFRKEIFSTSNLEWGGHAFSGDRYIPLDEKIEMMKPDIYLYSNMKDRFTNQIQQYEQAFRTMENANHFRISLDGKTIWSDFTKQLAYDAPPTLFVHDFDLNKIDGAFELLDDISSDIRVIKRRGAIANKFPIQVNNREDLLKWSSLQAAKQFYSLQYNGVMDHNTLKDFIDQCRGTCIPRVIDYVVTAGCSSENEFLEKHLREIYLQICFLRREKIRISLKYEDDFFSNPKWGQLLDLFNCYLNGFLRFDEEKQEEIISYDTLYSFCKSFRKFKRFSKRYIFDIDEARDLFKFVAENDYELFRMFYECSNVRLENGRLIPE